MEDMDIKKVVKEKTARNEEVESKGINLFLAGPEWKPSIKGDLGKLGLGRPGRRRQWKNGKETSIKKEQVVAKPRTDGQRKRRNNYKKEIKQRKATLEEKILLFLNKVKANLAELLAKKSYNEESKTETKKLPMVLINEPENKGAEGFRRMILNEPTLKKKKKRNNMCSKFGNQVNALNIIQLFIISF